MGFLAFQLLAIHYQYEQYEYEVLSGEDENEHLILCVHFVKHRRIAEAALHGNPSSSACLFLLFVGFFPLIATFSKPYNMAGHTTVLNTFPFSPADTPITQLGGLTDSNRGIQ